MENEKPGFTTPGIAVPVARQDLVWNPNLDSSFHFGKGENPRVVTPALRSALRAEPYVGSECNQLGSE
jgi:hypothetical protein